ncbi:unnamed protein product [Somion occarium]|uniref:F-box domain-containing protein n=1 Tax=Somion occarium TaxID=3059160 RepID=A0ABP1CHL8_9APHY
MAPQGKRARKSDEAVTGGQADVEPMPPEKKKKTRRRNVRGRRGVLKNLPDMPLDILYEVFSHLHPQDLLNLSRTTKAFRRLLMDRNAAVLWKEARQNIPDLPEPFPGMSEPAYASLCFDAQCHGCFKPGIREVLWEIRARFCNECKKSKTLSQETLIYRRGDYFGSYLPCAVVEISVTGKTELFWDKKRVLASEAARIKEDYAEVEHAGLCRKWYNNKKLNRAIELEDIKDARYKAIKNKLKELGYEKDVIYCEQYCMSKESLKQLSVVRQSKPLTERTWQTIRPTVIDFLTTTVTPLRIVHEYTLYLRPRAAILRKAVEKFARLSHGVFPHVRDFASLPEVRAILDPADKAEISVESFDALLPLLPELVTRWREDITGKLETFVRRELSSDESEDVPDGIRALDLAIATIFRCSHCKKPIVGAYPGTVSHRCRPAYVAALVQMTRGYGLWSKKQDDPFDTAIERALKWAKWSHRDVDLLKSDVEPVLEACGQNSLSTTAQDMDELDFRFRCKKCDSFQARAIFRWREAALHSRDCHGHDDSSLFFDIEDYIKRTLDTELWEAVSSEEARKIAPLERAASERVALKRLSKPIWCCVHCEMHELSRGGMITHIVETHGISTPSDDNLFADPARVKTRMPPVYIVADEYKMRVQSLKPFVKQALKDGEAMFQGDEI